MTNLKEPVWMSRLDKYFWPIVFILAVITLSVLAESAQAQQKTCVDTWRLEKACQDLILLDSLVKDYQEKDSVISTLKKLNQTRLSEIEGHKNVNKERSIQLDLSQSTTNNLMKENLIWKGEVRRIRRQRNIVVIATGIIIGILIVK